MLRPSLAGASLAAIAARAVDHLLDRVAGDEDAIARDTLAQQVVPAALGVGHEHGARVVDDPPVHLLGHALVEAAVARFHVEDGNASRLATIAARPLLVSPRISRRSGVARELARSTPAMIWPDLLAEADAADA